MPFRSDIYLLMGINPRLIVVPAPSTELTLEDLVDTLRQLEPELDNMDDFALFEETAGRNFLDTSTEVSITATLYNAQVYFEARTTVLSTGTVTSNDTKGVTLVDSTATFVSDGVERGHAVMNTTTFGMASVLSVDSETQVTVLPLSGGSRSDWQIGDTYRLYAQIQCNVSGGNLVAVDTDRVTPISTIFESPFTQVVRTASSSATTSNQTQLEHATFNNGVSYDATSPYSGTGYPKGTPSEPVNNWPDALAIAAERKFGTFYLLSDAALSGEDFSGYVFEGLGGRNNLMLTVDPSAVVLDCRFQDVSIQGTVSDLCHISDCVIHALTFAGTFIDRCDFVDDIALIGSADVTLRECANAKSGTSPPSISLASHTGEVNIFFYSGGIRFTDKTDDAELHVHLASGHVILDSTVSAGHTIVRGIGDLDSSITGTATVDADSLLARSTIASATWADSTAQRLLSHQGENVRDDVITRDPQTGNITLARRRVFPDKATAEASTHLGTGEGETATITVSAVYSGETEWDTLLRVLE